MTTMRNPFQRRWVLELRKEGAPTVVLGRFWTFGPAYRAGVLAVADLGWIEAPAGVTVGVRRA